MVERGQGSWLRDEQVAYVLILGISGVLPVNLLSHTQAPQGALLCVPPRLCKHWTAPLTAPGRQR
jgi:hypothetical protein